MKRVKVIFSEDKFFGPIKKNFAADLLGSNCLKIEGGSLQNCNLAVVHTVNGVSDEKASADTLHSIADFLTKHLSSEIFFAVSIDEEDPLASHIYTKNSQMVRICRIQAIEPYHNI